MSFPSGAFLPLRSAALRSVVINQTVLKDTLKQIKRAVLLPQLITAMPASFPFFFPESGKERLEKIL